MQIHARVVGIAASKSDLCFHNEQHHPARAEPQLACLAEGGGGRGGGGESALLPPPPPPLQSALQPMKLVWERDGVNPPPPLPSLASRPPRPQEVVAVPRGVKGAPRGCHIGSKRHQGLRR